MFTNCMKENTKELRENIEHSLSCTLYRLRSVSWLWGKSVGLNPLGELPFLGQLFPYMLHSASGRWTESSEGHRTTGSMKNGELTV